MKTTNFISRHTEIWKFIKFNFTIIVTSLLDLGIYTLLFYFVFNDLNQVPVVENPFLNFLGIHYKGYLYAYGISTTIGYIGAYWMNRKITFHSNANVVKSSVQYVIMVVLTIIFSTWLGSVVGTFMQENSLSNPFTELVAKFIVINIPTIWTYPIERFVIQKQYKIKNILALDLDSTVIDDNGLISDKNITAIKKLTKKNVAVAIVTGRTFFEIPEVLTELKQIKYFIYSNGTVVMDKYKNIIAANYLPKATTKVIYNILNEYDTMIELYSDKTPKTLNENLNCNRLNYFNVSDAYKNVILSTRQGVLDLSQAITDSQNIEMFNVYFKNQQQRAEALSKLNTYSSEINVTTSSSNNLEIFCKGVSKGSGLTALCENVNISLANVTAIGDSENDLSMFSVAGTSLAVNNACDKLKSVADKIICSNNESVIDYALNNIF